ncbi:hypothetical protein JTZ62_04825 [Mammaliicoccus sciuri]|uniref:hypothetical protein n=1 Tax=Mammaliicoccus sciuri TaxID=1296 RepID=UPI0019D38D99|nr:hypothetical protein [Mammaliicoccus sciuri]QSN68483.1 hypothetical protein JTZ62_04825 [Mammaliicoccus sciuri]UIU23224.1 hypothetical protein LLZ87_04835 [Mammaliicoccus sciuri]UIU26129.1 hypothetical protein LLZ92_04835 [Mammaliicoccus sciuri]
MKTKQFIEEINKLGYIAMESCIGSSTIEIFKRNGMYIEKLAKVDQKIKYSTDTTYSTFNKLKTEDKDKLFKLLTEYASTDIKDRKDIIKYRVRLNMLDETRNYLNMSKVKMKKRNKNEFFFGGATEGNSAIKNTFTSNELDQLPEALKLLFENNAVTIEPVVVN